MVQQRVTKSKPRMDPLMMSARELASYDRAFTGLLSLKDAEDLTLCSEGQLLHAIARDHISARKFGNTWVINGDSLLTWVLRKYGDEALANVASRYYAEYSI